MKLTEKQLAGLFQTNSKKNTSKSSPSDCMSATAASSNRLNQAEDLLNDYTAAQSMKMAMSLKDWSQVMADSIEASRRSWFSFLGMSSPLRTSVATMAFAFALVFALPELNQYSLKEQVHIPVQNDMANNDIINAIYFDGPSDQINQGGFDQPRNQDDGLFNAGFG